MATTTSGRLVKTSAQFTPEQHRWLLSQSRTAGETIAVLLRQLVRAEMEREATPTHERARAV